MIFEGWDNCDLVVVEEFIRHGLEPEPTRLFHFDVRVRDDTMSGLYDYVFANHSLSYLTYRELPGALDNIRDMLRPGGVVHILVPDALRAVQAYYEGDIAWFPLDHLMSVDDAFCAYVLWFGESRSVFTGPYLLNLGRQAGFSDVRPVAWGLDEHDDREPESLVVEFVR